MDQHPEIPRLAAYLRGHFPHMADWPEPRLHAWLEWFWNDGRIGIVQHHGRILGVCLARCVHTIEQAKEDYAHDDNAELVWVDAIAMEHPAAFPAMLRMCRHRFGKKARITGNLIKRKGRLFNQPITRLEQRHPSKATA
jgi:hypothetical protein